MLRLQLRPPPGLDIYTHPSVRRSRAAGQSENKHIVALIECTTRSLCAHTCPWTGTEACNRLRCLRLPVIISSPSPFVQLSRIHWFRFGWSCCFMTYITMSVPSCAYTMIRRSFGYRSVTPCTSLLFRASLSISSAIFLSFFLSASSHVSIASRIPSLRTHPQSNAHHQPSLPSLSVALCYTLTHTHASFTSCPHSFPPRSFRDPRPPFRLCRAHADVCMLPCLPVVDSVRAVAALPDRTVYTWSSADSRTLL
ncbi:hypothetical protein L227DRAFT_104842 [Lentinus tigrinus ALCF2SS1-6]|uniref:Uncharacterized protein n=1 Tax=Lentinus tigrinus ALCF2SS1-6 TaxID=1328759 RepID=A0A5C2S864_9APHY|nr:hypothetical protein L227DRAFT_104842 [Lentinus tigrinus ALCF2SS1-6]